MEKIVQEFRIIETDDGYRIEIKGDKEMLRGFIEDFDPRRWMHRGPGPGKGFPFGPRWMRHGFGPHGPAPHAHGPHEHGPHEGPWDWDEDAEEEVNVWPRGKRKGRRRYDEE